MINDGYTVQAKVKWLWFVYRPATKGEIDLLFESVFGCNKQKSIEVANKFLSGHILDWDYWQLPDESGLQSLWNLSGRDNRKSKDNTWKLVYQVVLGAKKPDIGDQIIMSESEKNLREGVPLQVNYPWLSSTSCDFCKKYWYDPQEDYTARDKDGSPRLREGVLLCETASGCPKGTPENNKSLNTRNRQAFKHYLECETTNRFPPDPIVKRHAVVIKGATNGTTDK